MHPIKKFIIDNDLSSYELGMMSGLSGNYIRNIYRNHHNMTKKTSLKLSKATGIHPAIIMFPELDDIVINNN